MKIITKLLVLAILLGLAPSCRNDDNVKDKATPVDHNKENDAKTDDAETDLSASWLFPIGTVSGSCGVLDDEEWNSDAPFIFRNIIDLGAGYDEDNLSEEAFYIATSDNAGGSSVKSEALSFELLHVCEAAELLKIETEIEYDVKGVMTDILVEIDGRKIGVSVARAFAYNRDYSIDDAEELLNHKLGDLPYSMANASDDDRWERSVLYIMAYDENSADQIEAAFAIASAELKSNAIIMMTVTDGEDENIYRGK